MKRAREIEAANDRLGNAAGSNRLEALLVDRFYRVYHAHAHEHRDDLIFSCHLGYPFVNYTFALDNENEAKQLFVRHFDHHATLQEENYLVQHEASIKAPGNLLVGACARGATKGSGRRRGRVVQVGVERLIQVC